MNEDIKKAVAAERERCTRIAWEQGGNNCNVLVELITGKPLIEWIDDHDREGFMSTLINRTAWTTTPFLQHGVITEENDLYVLLLPDGKEEWKDKVPVSRNDLYFRAEDAATKCQEIADYWERKAQELRKDV